MPGSAPRSTMRPRHPSSRKVTAALPPAIPVPTMTTICSLVAFMFIVKNPLGTSCCICSVSAVLTSMLDCLLRLKHSYFRMKSKVLNHFYQRPIPVPDHCLLYPYTPSPLSLFYRTRFCPPVFLKHVFPPSH